MPLELFHLVQSLIQFYIKYKVKVYNITGWIDNISPDDLQS